MVFNWARLLGHTIIEPRPALSPIEIKENWVKELSGLSLQDIGLNVWLIIRLLKMERGYSFCSFWNNWSNGFR
jgi:hypothetical protein